MAIGLRTSSADTPSSRQKYRHCHGESVCIFINALYRIYRCGLQHHRPYKLISKWLINELRWDFAANLSTAIINEKRFVEEWSILSPYLPPFIYRSLPLPPLSIPPSLLPLSLSLSPSPPSPSPLCLSPCLPDTNVCAKCVSQAKFLYYLILSYTILYYLILSLIPFQSISESACGC